jgi:hypothetical protein
VSRALLALRYLTILPMSRRRHAGLEDLGRATLWFPVVGAALGLVLAAVDAGTGRVFPPLLAAVLTVTVWKLLTGGLHLDGLADCLDGLSGRDAATRLAIMGDSRIGTFGTIGLILFLMLELAAVSCWGDSSPPRAPVGRARFFPPGSTAQRRRRRWPSPSWWPSPCWAGPASLPSPSVPRARWVSAPSWRAGWVASPATSSARAWSWPSWRCC